MLGLSGIPGKAQAGAFVTMETKPNDEHKIYKGVKRKSYIDSFVGHSHMSILMLSESKKSSSWSKQIKELQQKELG